MRPKQFYEQLLADVQRPQQAHVALFVQNMWWYIFHPTGEQPCAAPVAISHRRLGGLVVVEPRTGDKLKFGTIYPIAWTDRGYACNQVEIWRYGSFVQRLQECSHAARYDWLVSPDSADRQYLTQKTGLSEEVGTTKGFRSSQGVFQPGDRYTIRVCDGHLDDNEPFDEQKCDDSFGESGEFDVEPTTALLEPGCDASFAAPTNIQAVWTSYYIAHASLTIQLYTTGNVLVFQEQDIANTGYYNFYATHDLPSGGYYFKVSATCGSGCTNYWMGQGTTTIGTGCRFGITAAASPPSPPASTEPYEVPIMKTFESGYNAFGGDSFTANTGITYGDFDTHGDNSCETACLVGRGRRLLFGGLNNMGGGGGNGWMPENAPCTARQIQCNCNFC